MKEKIDEKLFEVWSQGRKARRIALTEKGLQELLDEIGPGAIDFSSSHNLKCPHCGRLTMTYQGVPVYIIGDEDVSIE